MKPFILFLLFVIFTSDTFCQEDRQSGNFTAKVIDSNTKEVLHYATVFNINQRRGTASSGNGFFNLPNNAFGDSIIISYIGYSDQIIIYQVGLDPVVSMVVQETELEEIVVKAASDYLYDMLVKLRSCKRSSKQTAKTYFFLESQQKGQVVEMIESYFQGVYSNCSLQKLDIKKGRIGLKPIDNRYYLSTETSRIFSMHDIFTASNLFPSNPLCFGKSKMKKAYQLRLNHTYLLEEQKIFVIDFEPKDTNSKKNSKNIFSGRIWVDKDKNQLVKIKLNIDESKKHPFKPIGQNKILHSSMEITKTFTMKQAEAFINSIDFNYTVAYEDFSNTPFEAKTKAFLKAYDFDNSLQLPHFEFTDLLHQDYRNMTIVPYDSLFWQSTDEFRIFEHESQIEQFLNANHLQNKIIIPDSSTNQSCLQYHYVTWSENRFDIRQTKKEGLTIDNFRKVNSFNDDQYNFNCKIYLDVNEYEGKQVFQLFSIMDPVDSYFELKVSNEARAFANMYFDLLEIERRKLENQFLQNESISKKEIENLYQKSIERFEVKAKKFRNETLRGMSETGMKKWNNLIYDELGIDNLKIFCP